MSLLIKEPTATPPEGRPSQVPPLDTHSQGLSSPPEATQPIASQLLDAQAAIAEEVEDEVKEGVWGYLFPLGNKFTSKPTVLKKRTACPKRTTVSDTTQGPPKSPRSIGTSRLRKEEEAYERMKAKSITSGGYLIGRHIECGESLFHVLLLGCANYPPRLALILAIR